MRPAMAAVQPYLPVFMVVVLADNKSCMRPLLHNTLSKKATQVLGWAESIKQRNSCINATQAWKCLGRSKIEASRPAINTRTQVHIRA